jgi:hypothetical protein
MAEAFIFIGRNLRSNHTRRAEHWRQCELQCLPFIAVEARREFAYVKIDLLTYAWPLRQEQLSRIELLLGEFREDGGILDIAPLRCSCDKVPRESAMHVARELWRFAMSAGF